MNRARMTVAVVLAGAALTLPAVTGTAAAQPADSGSAAGCRAGARTPAADPHEYDSCINGEWGNIRRCPPHTIVYQVPDGDVRCIPE